MTTCIGARCTAPVEKSGNKGQKVKAPKQPRKKKRPSPRKKKRQRSGEASGMSVSKKERGGRPARKAKNKQEKDVPQQEVVQKQVTEALYIFIIISCTYLI